MARQREGAVTRPRQSVRRFVESLILTDDCPFEPSRPVRFKCTGWKPLSVKRGGWCGHLAKTSPCNQPVCHPIYQEKARCVSLTPVLCSGMTPSETACLVLIGLSVTPLHVPWGHLQLPRTHPVLSSSSLTPLNSSSPHWGQSDLFKGKPTQPVQLSD